MGGEAFDYHAQNYLINTHTIPVMTEVISGPFLGFVLELDPKIVASVLLDLGSNNVELAPGRALSVSLVEDGLLDPVVRLLRLLDKPKHLAALAPALEREIIYWLLQSSHGTSLRHFAMPSSQLSRISRAIDYIRTHYHEPLKVEQLTQLASMSLSTFHRHFCAVTGLSPIQYQKRIRLHEARRRLLSEKTDAATVAFEIGYSSPSQFSREYRRLFGEPPKRDVSRVRSYNLV